MSSSKIIWLFGFGFLYTQHCSKMERSFSASVNLYSNQFHFFMEQSSVYILLHYLTLIVCSKVEEVAIENHKD